MNPVILPNTPKTLLYTGVTEQAIALVSENIISTKVDNQLYILLDKNIKGIEAWADDIAYFQNTFQRKELTTIKVLPEIGDIQDPDNPRAFELQCDRLSALTTLQELKDEKQTTPLILATTPKALLEPCPPPEDMRQEKLLLTPGQTINFQDLVNQLTHQLGYDSEIVCETPGQFAVRGGLIDIYPLNGTAPCRIDFFGDEIESIRHYDPTTQRSESTIDRVTITPAPTQFARVHHDNFLQYLPEKVTWLLKEPDQLKDKYPALFQYPERIAAPEANFQNILTQRKTAQDSWLGFTELDETRCLFPENTAKIVCDSESLQDYRTSSYANKLGIGRFESEQASRAEFLKQILQWQAEKYAIFFVSKKESEHTRLQEILTEDPSLKKLKPTYLQGSINEGFRLAFSESCPAWPKLKNHTGIVFTTEAELYGRNKVRITSGRRRKLPERAPVDQLLDFSELVDGDYLVHVQNGVCIFRGLQQLEFNGKTEEVISLEFDQDVTVHLKLHESHLLSRYVGLSKMHPKLGRIGTNQWEKTRANAERATLDFAAELLGLQASRENEPGFAFSPDGSWQHEFEATFPFSETRDQLRTIQETKADMEKDSPMDRLVCGDVGFGKTEIALRAAFKAVMDGKQVAVLIPTTVLAQQHFITFKERMAEFPVVVEMLSRFRNPAQRKQIITQFNARQIDILVGTHSLLNKSMDYSNTGLLIIDEEHRFGVRHKEQIKALKLNVDVLTMSATPIPRTLYFALMGARELSVIETAPRDRLPIQTVVKSYQPKLVKEAIEFEINRGGQVFYLHNRVQTIETVAERLKEMLPDLRVVVGHGQMSQDMLEKIMTRFVAGEYDVLVCTTIIESGLDIPNCNTIIIEGADRFGLSQLYQLRGRVGRFNRQAYAYLLLHRHTQLLDLARKRLGAIRQYNKLGAGFRIAMRDLELRGAGNLLGSKQSGHIAGVGFDLYCQLLRQSISRLKGEEDAVVIRAMVQLDFIVVGEKYASGSQETAIGYSALKQDELQNETVQKLEAFIPANYISEARLRIDIYRKLAMASIPQEVKDVGQEIKDRFGKYPTSVKALLELTEVRCLAEQSGIVHVETEGNRLKCRIGTAQSGTFIKIGNRFPRLTAKKPLLRLAEIKKLLKLHSNNKK